MSNSSAQKRIYTVQAANGDVMMVKASSQAQALRHIAKSIYTVHAASALEVADHCEAGGKIEDAAETELAAGAAE